MAWPYTASMCASWRRMSSNGHVHISATVIFSSGLTLGRYFATCAATESFTTVVKVVLLSTSALGKMASSRSSSWSSLPRQKVGPPALLATGFR